MPALSKRQVNLLITIAAFCLRCIIILLKVHFTVFVLNYSLLMFLCFCINPGHVPIVEPEILMDGDNNIEKTLAVQGKSTGNSMTTTHSLRDLCSRPVMPYGYWCSVVCVLVRGVLCRAELYCSGIEYDVWCDVHCSVVGCVVMFCVVVAIRYCV